MPKIIDFETHRSPENDPPRTRNQELLAQIQAEAKAADTPEARLLNELRATEEILLANHRQYVRLWEAADQLGITPPVRTAEQIVRDADIPPGMLPVTPCLTPYTDAPAEAGTPANVHDAKATDKAGETPTVRAETSPPRTPEPASDYARTLDATARRAQQRDPDRSIDR
jgi:hypothetical protein